MDYEQQSLKMHQAARGKLAVVSKVSMNSQHDLSLAYSPGVAGPCRKIAENEDDIYLYTGKGNAVAVVTDGTAVLGLGDIGPKAALPVMEGKAILFRTLAGIDAYPICLATKDVEEIIRTVKLISPGFGAINLEDIASPRCFEIEERLKNELDIPVFHDDQHGTAICVLAGLINAHKVVNKDLSQSRVVINGAGAAGIAIGKLLLEYGVRDLIMVDRGGIINRNDPSTQLHSAHAEMALKSNPSCLAGNLAAALLKADAFVGVSKPGLVTTEMVATMNSKAIVFALANPDPEIYPEQARAGGAAVIGTGRSDFPNMINNVLVFPGMLKGALAVRASTVNEPMKLAAAIALANSIPVEELNPDRIFPQPLDNRIPCVIAQAVMQAARETGVARI